MADTEAPTQEEPEEPTGVVVWSFGWNLVHIDERQAIDSLSLDLSAGEPPEQVMAHLKQENWEKFKAASRDINAVYDTAVESAKTQPICCMPPALARRVTVLLLLACIAGGLYTLMALEGVMKAICIPFVVCLLLLTRCRKHMHKSAAAAARSVEPQIKAILSDLTSGSMDIFWTLDSNGDYERAISLRFGGMALASWIAAGGVPPKT